jgi:hypothetical protein
MKSRDAPYSHHPLKEILIKQEITSLSTFEIMYDDLTLKAQIRLCETFNTHPSMENWEIQPLALVSREEE